MWGWERALLDREITELKKKVGFISALDFACGTGRIITLTEKLVDHSVGVDISSSMLEYARGKLSHTELICADLTTNDVLRGNYFQLITAFRIFLNSDAKLRDEMLAVLVSKLAPDGHFIFNMHGNLWSHRMLTKLYFWFRGRRLNTSSYWQVKKMIDPHGLVIKQFYGFGVIPKPFYRIARGKYIYALDRFFACLPLMRWFSNNLVFVCARKNTHADRKVDPQTQEDIFTA